MAKSSKPSISSAVTPTEEVVSKENPLRILLTEDEKVQQKIVMTQLTKLGQKATCVDNGQQAVEKLKKEEFDLVLMDIQMPVMDGFETTLKIRSEIPKKRQPAIVALTAHEPNKLRGEMDWYELDEVLGKPVKQYDLARLLIKVPRLKRQRLEQSERPAIEE